MIKSFGQMEEVDRVRELWKQMTARGLQSGPVHSVAWQRPE